MMQLEFQIELKYHLKAPHASLVKVFMNNKFLIKENSRKDQAKIFSTKKKAVTISLKLIEFLRTSTFLCKFFFFKGKTLEPQPSFTPSPLLIR